MRLDISKIKEPKLIGKDEDGLYLGRVEMIGTSEMGDTLYLSNRKPNAWLFSAFTGYQQIGVFKTNTFNYFKEGENVIVKKKDDKVIRVVKE